MENRYEKIDRFRLFLNERNCLVSFFHRSLNNKGLQYPRSLIDCNLEISFLKSQFSWFHTEEGSPYWEKMYMLWLKY